MIKYYWIRFLVKFYKNIQPFANKFVDYLNKNYYGQ